MENQAGIDRDLDRNSARRRLEQWNYFRNSFPRQVRRTLEKVLLAYIEKYQEHLFIPPSGEVPELQDPELVHEITKNFPRGVLRNSIKSSAEIGPCAETLLDIGWSGLEVGEYYPTESTMVDIFLGRYLERFSKLKGYKTHSNDSLRGFTVRHHKEFAPQYSTRNVYS